MELTSTQENKNLLHYKFTPAGGFIVCLLVLALVALGERVLYDLARWAIGSSHVDYFDNLQIIIVHAMFIILLLIISLVVNIGIGDRKQKYALALIPYFVLSIVLALQLALQVSVYFTNHHTKIQFYIVMSVLSAVCTVAIYLVQKRYNPST